MDKLAGDTLHDLACIVAFRGSKVVCPADGRPGSRSLVRHTDLSTLLWVSKGVFLRAYSGYPFGLEMPIFIPESKYQGS